ncbi:MAG TPA: hypothetical protein VIM84_10510 [Gemmatimonadales bacterium]
MLGEEHDGESWWYSASLGDETHTPKCECPHHVNRLAGTCLPCKHLTRVHRYLDERDRQQVSGPDPTQEQPDPAWVRGACPACGGVLVANCYYSPGRGYLMVHQCWESLAAYPRCSYRRVI